MESKKFINNIDNCNICYEFSEIIILQCCNGTKHICNNCLECLKKPICPWCRQDLTEELIKKQMINSSDVDSYNNYLEVETGYLLINPYDSEFYDSKILRKTMRNIRNRFNRITMQRRANERKNRQLSISTPTPNNLQMQNRQHTFSQSIPSSNDSLSSEDSNSSVSSDENYFNTTKQKYKNEKKNKHIKKIKEKCHELTKEITQQINNDTNNNNISNDDDIINELFSFEF